MSAYLPFSVLLISFCLFHMYVYLCSITHVIHQSDFVYCVQYTSIFMVIVRLFLLSFVRAIFCEV